MADNYIGNRMDDYRAGRLAAGAPRRVTHTGSRPGSLSLPVNPDHLVWIEDGALLPAGRRLVELLTAAGLHVAFRAPAGREGALLAQQFGARHFPDGVTAPPAQFVTIVSNVDITLDAGRVRVGFSPGAELSAARLAASFCSIAGAAASASLSVSH